MSCPEVAVSLLSDPRMGKDEDDRNDNDQQHTGDARHCAKYPVREGRLRIRLKLKFLGETAQMLHWLSGDMVKVDAMAHCVHN